MKRIIALIIVCVTANLFAQTVNTDFKQWIYIDSNYWPSIWGSEMGWTWAQSNEDGMVFWSYEDSYWSFLNYNETRYAPLATEMKTQWMGLNSTDLDISMTYYDLSSQNKGTSTINTQSVVATYTRVSFSKGEFNIFTPNYVMKLIVNFKLGECSFVYYGADGSSYNGAGACTIWFTSF